MTDPVETKAPERIWAGRWFSGGRWWRTERPALTGKAWDAEYICADLVAAIVADAVKAEREACARLAGNKALSSKEAAAAIRARTP